MSGNLPLPLPPPGTTVKRQKTTRDCFICEKSARACDGKRPCSACVSLGMPQLCVSADRGANTTRAPVPYAASALLGAPSPAKPKPAKPPSSGALPIGPGTLGSVLAQRKRAPGHISASPPLTEISPEFLGGTSPTALVPLQASQGPNALRQIPQSQLEFNQLILRELSKLQHNQAQTQMEVLTLRLENMSLKSQLKCLTEGADMDAVIVPHAGHLSSALEFPTVVYNLQEHPPRVMWANELFCTMLGYPQAEVTGEPWHKFIHSEYIERTQKMIAEAAAQRTTVIEFEQVYIDKMGRIYLAQDTHHIINGPRNIPLADHVRITLSSYGSGFRSLSNPEPVSLLPHQQSADPQSSFGPSSLMPPLGVLDHTVHPSELFPPAGDMPEASPKDPFHEDSPFPPAFGGSPFRPDQYSPEETFLQDDADANPWALIQGSASPVNQTEPDVFSWLMDDDPANSFDLSGHS